MCSRLALCAQIQIHRHGYASMSRCAPRRPRSDAAPNRGLITGGTSDRSRLPHTKEGKKVLPAMQYSQIAWVVDDLDAAMQKWQQTARIGPFFRGEHLGGILADARHRGRPFEVDVSIAVAQAGPVQIELIKQHGSAPSPYRDVFVDGESGLHHICGLVDDVEAECRIYQERDFDVVMTASIAGRTPVAYVDTRAMLGCMTELVGRCPFVGAVDAAIAAAAANWDGSEPVRDFATLLS